MKSRVYLETTIVSYLTAWPSRELVMASNQAITRDWWDDRRQDFDVFVSQLVVEEAGAGDQEAARKRLEVLSSIPRLQIAIEAENLADVLLREMALPSKARADALHIATAAVNGMDFLLTWNCRHIANAEMRSQIEEICRNADYEPPIICTPQELLESEDHDAG